MRFVHHIVIRLQIGNQELEKAGLILRVAAFIGITMGVNEDEEILI